MLVKLLLFAPLVFSTFVGSMFGSNSKMNRTGLPEYEIYPLPHKIDYRDNFLTIKDNVNLCYTKNIDESTVNHGVDVFSLKDVKVYKNKSTSPDDFTLVNLKTFKDVTLGNELEYLHSKYDAYYLDISSNGIEIIGKDSDAAFYALTSLEYIFEETGNDREIRQLTIEDYSDLKYRGFIEGAYGDPWKPEYREELMRFGSKFKTNVYFYAPKDDQYHSATWRELYDRENLERLKEQIQEGIRTKTRFVFALHPFINDPYTGTATDMYQLIRKLEQVYQAGVRQFMISGDDALIPGVTNPWTDEARQANLKYAIMQNECLNLVAQWLREKGDCYDLSFVPGAYCWEAETALSCFNIEYYFKGLIYGSDYASGKNSKTMLDESIDVMWTGRIICSRLSDGKLDEFIQFTGGRKPFIWMNWPVNDYSPDILRIGPGEVFDEIYEDTESAKISAMVNNLMLEYESNKVSIFATADYCWNTRDFNSQKSYRASLRRVEKNTPDSLFEICEHLRNTHVPFSNEFFSEATELSGLIAEFEAELKAGDATNSINKLVTYFNKLKYSCDDFLTNGANKRLIKEMEAWVKSIRYASLCALEHLKVISNKYSYHESMFYKKQASNLYNLFKHQSIKSPNAATYNVKYVDVRPGVHVLEPFIERLDELSNNVASLTGVKISLEKYPGSDALGPDVELYYQGVDGKMDYMVDGDLSSRAYFMFNDWLYGFQFDLIFDYGASQEVHSIDLLQGETDRLWCWIEYSNDGVNYQRIPYVSEVNKNLPFDVDNNGLLDGEMTDSGYYRAVANTHIEFENPFTARYIKLKNFHTNCRVLIYELMLNGASPSHKDIVTFKGLELAEGQDINNLLLNKPVEFKPFTSEEMILDYDLGEQKIISNINFQMDSNYNLENYQLFISKDGYNYYQYDKEEKTECRFIRIYSNLPTNKKLIINKLEAQ